MARATVSLDQAAPVGGTEAIAAQQASRAAAQAAAAEELDPQDWGRVFPFDGFQGNGPSAPRNLQQMAMWPTYVVRRLQDDQKMYKLFSFNFHEGIDIFTSYSGFGMPELSIHALELALLVVIVVVVVVVVVVVA